MAGLGRKEWSPGDTLNAADVNGYLMDQSVMVFAGTAARASAIPIPSAGMVAYSTATQLEYYDGAAWEPIGITPGLTYIAQATPTAVNTVSINSCFTSTYANYLMLFDLSAAVGDGSFTARLRLSGTDATTNYRSQRLGGQGAVTFASSNVSGTDDFYLAGIEAATASTYAWQTNLFSPALARQTVAIGVAAYTIAGGSVIEQVWNNHSTATAYDGITVNYSGTSFTGTIRIYGYQNS